MSVIQTIKFYIITIYYLKLSQILWRIYYLIKPKFSVKIKNVEILKIKKLKNKFIIKSNSIKGKNSFLFLNELREIKTDKAIDQIHLNKLWLYNLNYFDFLNSNLTTDQKNITLNFLKRWLKEVKSINYVGLDPYPTSLRIVNWIKWYLSGNLVADDMKSSLVMQTEHLSKNIEWHLLGNHLLANAKALIFSGIVFDGQLSKQWKSKGIEIYKKQIDIQILDDGGHFEKSPMYHAIILEDLLDLINIGKLFSNSLPKYFIDKLIYKAEKMLYWLEVMSYNNGENPHFNDSTKNISSNIIELKKYALKLKILMPKNICTKEKIDFKELVESGFIRVDTENSRTFLDVGTIGAPYIPGHAHADTLSFEASFFDQRFIVNSGISTYEKSDRRSLERSTYSHNTVEIDQKNSSDVWASFRVDSRADIIDLKKNKSKKSFCVSCSHDGYNSIFKKNIHQRQWSFSEKKLIITDSITLNKSEAIARFILHPDIKIKQDGFKNMYSFTLENNIVKLHVEKGGSIISDMLYAPEFGILLKTKCISIKLVDGTSKVILTW